MNKPEGRFDPIADVPLRCSQCRDVPYPDMSNRSKKIASIRSPHQRSKAASAAH
jgi:hypothetical protein